MRDLVSLPVPQSLGESDAPQVEGIVEWAAATGTPTTVEWAAREISDVSHRQKFVVHDIS